MSSPTCSVTRSWSMPTEELRREVEAGRRRRRRARVVGVDGLVPLGVVGLLADVRREREHTRGLALQPDTPPALAELLDQLDGRAM